MKTLLTAAALAIAFLAPAAEARVAKHQDTTHASSTVKAKHKKHAKKRAHKTGL